MHLLISPVSSGLLQVRLEPRWSTSTRGNRWSLLECTMGFLCSLLDALLAAQHTVCDILTLLHALSCLLSNQHNFDINEAECIVVQ